MNVSFKKTLKASSGFAAAMAAVGGSQYAEATIVTVSVSPDVNYPLSGVTVGLSWAGGAVSWGGYNDSIGKTLDAFGAASAMKIFSSGVTIKTTNIGTNNSINRPTNQTGTQILGFKTSSNLLGWFKVNWGGSGGTLSFTSGYINTVANGSIVAGGSTDGGGGGGGATVPEPSSAAVLGLGGLAMGAVALRRRRQQKADSAA